MAKVKEAEDALVLISQNIVQGVKGDGDDAFVLNIRNETERGDNDSLKKAKKSVGKCDSK